MPEGNAQLYSRVVLNTVERMQMSDVRNPVSTTSHVFPIPHPEPAHPDGVGITRVLSRLHVHNPREIQMGANEFVLALFRASDFSLVGGAVFETTPWGPNGDNLYRLVSADRETIWSPDYFLLAPGDGLIAVMEAFGGPSVFTTVGAFVAIAYVRLRPDGRPE